MANIVNDVYSLEFNGEQFKSEVDSLIIQIQELESALASAQESGEGLEEIQSELSGTVKKLEGALSKEAGTLEGLNQKQLTLSRTQSGLNKESAAYAPIAKANTQANTQLANSTVTATKNNQTLAQSVVSGARSFNALRRAGTGIAALFRIIAGVSPFGLLLTTLPSVIGFFGRLVGVTSDAKDKTMELEEETKSIAQAYGKETSELNNLFGALNDANESGADKSAIISEIQSKYGEYIGNINLETASQEELAQAYNLAASAIARQVIAKQKAITQEQIIGKILEESIKLNLESAKSIDVRNAEIAKTENAIRLAAQAGDVEGLRNFEEQLRRLQTELPGTSKAGREAAKAISTSQQELIDKLKALDSVAPFIEQALVGAVDPTTLTGNLDKSGKAVTKATEQYRVLEGSLAALEARLSDLQKVLREQQAVADDAGLADTQKQIEAQQELVDVARKKIADLQGIALAEENIQKLITNLIFDETERRIAVLNQQAEKERQAVVGTEAQKAKQVQLINEQLAREIQDLRQKSIDDTIKAIEEERQKTLEARQRAADAELAVTTATIERKLAIELQGLERERNQVLESINNEVLDNETRLQKIEAAEKEYTKRRVELEKEAQKEILEVRLDSLQNTIKALEAAGDTAIEEKKQVEQLKLELIELDKTEPTVNVDVDAKNAKDKIKDFILNTLPEIQQVTDALFDAIGQQFAAITQRIDEAVSRSQTALDEIRNNSETYNADQLALEKQRLEQLQQAREQAVQREKTVAAIQVAFNSAVAIARAAAEGGVAAPFTIAATLIALVAGLASARNAASGAFYEGTEYLPLGKNKKGRDTITVRAHEGERIVPTQNNLKYFDAYSAMQNERMPASVANAFANGYLKGGLRGAIGEVSGLKLAKDVNLQERYGRPNFFFNNVTDTKRLESRIDELAKELRLLPQKMPVSTFNVNERGLYMSLKRYVGRQEIKAKRAK